MSEEKLWKYWKIWLMKVDFVLFDFKDSIQEIMSRWIYISIDKWILETRFDNFRNKEMFTEMSEINFLGRKPGNSRKNNLQKIGKIAKYFWRKEKTAVVCIIT